jgi:hypothetical protein
VCSSSIFYHINWISSEQRGLENLSLSPKYVEASLSDPQVLVPNISIPKIVLQYYLVWSKNAHFRIITMGVHSFGSVLNVNSHVDSVVVDVFTHVITMIALRDALDVRSASSAYLHMTTLKALGFVESLLFSCLITCIASHRIDSAKGGYLYKILERSLCVLSRCSRKRFAFKIAQCGKRL